MSQEEPPVSVDFFLIGAGKSGSTWLAQCLAEHPKIAIARGKEPNFFVYKLEVFEEKKNRNFMSDWDRYRNLFVHAAPGQICGDCSVNLLHNTEKSPAILKTYYPNAKILIILRNPIDRTYSHYWHDLLYDRCKGVPRSFEEALKNPELIFRSMYFQQIHVWLHYFDPAQVHVVLDVDQRHDPLEAIRQVYGFLDVDTSFAPPSALRRVNDAAARSRLVIVLEKKIHDMRLGSLVRMSRIRKLGIGRLIGRLTTRPNRYPPMNPHTRERLREMLRPDIEELQKLLGRDLSEWLA